LSTDKIVLRQLFDFARRVRSSVNVVSKFGFAVKVLRKGVMVSRNVFYQFKKTVMRFSKDVK